MTWQKKKKKESSPFAANRDIHRQSSTENENKRKKTFEPKAVK